MHFPTITDLLTRVPVIFLALTVHEFCHAYAALRCGDDTAKRAGRLTLNPMAHLDLLGTICLLIGPFGWAKPVPVNPNYFRNPRQDEVTVSLAGPGSNFAMAIISAILVKIFADFVQLPPYDAPLLYILLFWGVYINVGLGIFNLIPVYPLDGSHIFRNVLPWRMADKLVELERHGPLIFLALIVLGNTTGLFYIMFDVPTKALLNLIVRTQIYNI
jgi:Zn-dependent protease